MGSYLVCQLSFLHFFPLLLLNDHFSFSELKKLYVKLDKYIYIYILKIIFKISQKQNTENLFSFPKAKKSILKII